MRFWPNLTLGCGYSGCPSTSIMASGNWTGRAMHAARS
jgi:hypothetical protein